MASASSTLVFFSLLVIPFAVVQIAMAGDPDIVSDFLIPPNVTTFDGSFFTFTGMRALVGAQPPSALKVSKVSAAEFPSLIAELLFLADGSLQVGFVDTTNKLFTQTLQAGDMFIFPKGLVHFQYNADAQNTALAISAFGSASAGTVSLPTTLFATSIDDNILALAFKTDVATIQALKAGLAPKI
ncbi:hypothetical protein BDE02_13G105900 [Populus trichocarpa]|uniref:Germin-like protein n=1 Tax=Populus trichocarpa TaxID=3694 RepID=U5FSF7_POPTR|nr:hypothetical protein BDE02_13G105900 [Populus trichocarpa]